MTDSTDRWCVLIPCSQTETWAVPQNCLAEILTLHSDTDQPPAEVNWRGQTVPVLDIAGDDGSPWRQKRRETGLVALFLGLKGEGCEYWGLAVRGEGLRMVSLSTEEVEDMPEQVQEHATAAFDFHGVLCQVPDLDGFQKKMAVNDHAT
jgi:hypothetical protein